MRESGVSTLVAEEGVRFLPMWEDRGPSGTEAPMLRAPFAGAKSLKEGLLLPRVLLRHLQVGLYLSVPRMKVHRFAVTSLAIKNTMGFVSLDGASPTVSLRSGLHRELGAWMATRKSGHEDRALFTRAVERFAERIVDVFELAVPDAVLIAHKNRAQDVKQAVATLKARNARQAESFSKDHRPWGWFESLAVGERFQVKRIVVKPGGSLSLQSHVHRAEHWIVVEGTAQVTIGSDQRMLTENQSVYVPLGAVHRLENPGKVPVVLIEVQTGSYLGEDDITRYEDIYRRT